MCARYCVRTRIIIAFLDHIGKGRRGSEGKMRPVWLALIGGMDPLTSTPRKEGRLWIGEGCEIAFDGIRPRL